MMPQRMQLSCNLFDPSTARLEGVGAALHQIPPGIVESAGVPQPDAIICSRAHMDAIHDYDINSMSSRRTFEFLGLLPNTTGDIDWSDGATFPWWLWLATNGSIRDVAADGIYGIRACVKNNGESKSIVVNSTSDEYRIVPNAKGDNIITSPTPPEYHD